MTYIIPQAEFITPEELQERKYIEEIRLRAASMTEFDVELLVQRMIERQKRSFVSDYDLIQTLYLRAGMNYCYTISEMFDDPDSDTAWNFLFYRERELMEADYAQHKALLNPEPTPVEPKIEPIALGTYSVAELRKAIKQARKGKDDILLETAHHGLIVSDWHRLLGSAKDIETFWVQSLAYATREIRVTLPGMELSYPGKNGGILDIETEGDVTIAIVGEYLTFECGNWTYRLKNWERQS